MSTRARVRDEKMLSKRNTRSGYLHYAGQSDMKVKRRQKQNTGTTARALFRKNRYYRCFVVLLSGCMLL